MRSNPLDDVELSKTSVANMIDGRAIYVGLLWMGILLNPNHTTLAQDNLSRVQAVTKWLENNALPIQGIEAGRRPADLQPLKRVFQGVRVIGLGEATHGTHEFFLFKHRLLEFLVREMNVSVLAIETGYGSSSDINDYVMGKPVGGAQALANQGFWPLNTSEMLALLDWLRTYNASVPPNKRVKVVGFDIHYNDQGKQKILSYLKRVAPERLTATEALFSINVEKSLEAAFFTKSEKERADLLAKLVEVREKYNELLGFLTLNEMRFTNQMSAAEYNQLREYARVLAQLADSSAQPLEVADGPLRDYYMAENIKRIVDAGRQGTRVVVWAHNQHISAGQENEKYPYMGHHLRRFFDDAYYPIGFSFNEGSFQARDFNPKANRELKTFTVGPAPEGCVDWYFARVNMNNYFVDLRHSAKTQTVAQWLTIPQPMRFIGSYYDSQAEKRYFIPTTLARDFSGIVFFDQTTPSRPNH